MHRDFYFKRVPAWRFLFRNLEERSIMVQDLVNQIVEKTGVPPDKAQQVLGVVASFVKQKYPMVGSHIDSMLGTTGSADGGNTTNNGGSAFMGDIGGKLGF
jgi:hypothetical protein